MEFRDEFVGYLSEAIGEENVAAALSGLAEPASVSVRLNPSKAAGVTLPILEGAVRVPWSPEGYLLRQRPVFTLHPLFHSGVYYVQDSSAMFVGHIFRQCLAAFGASAFGRRPVRVLDLCAAPGGKTTDLAASLREVFGDGFVLVANEVMKNRAAVLADNVARWGDPNVVVTSADPRAFARLEGFFDIVVADVPCSGEGMFRKDEEAIAQWSPDNVRLCAERQRRIIADAYPALAPGGVLIYSTCTFNIYENDGNVGWICSELGATPLAGLTVNDSAATPSESSVRVLPTGSGFSLVPGFVPGEGQYCAALLKTGAASGAHPLPAPSVRPLKPFRAPKDPSAALVQNLLSVPVATASRGGMLVAVPLSIASEIEAVRSALPVLAAGCAVGQLKGRDLVPDEDLALSTMLRRGAFPEVEVSKEMALAFLHKDAIVLEDAPSGIVMLTYRSVPLGFVKNLGNRTNNLHPQGRRIRMDIK